MAIKTSMNCSFVASPPKTALNDSFNFWTMSFGCKSFTPLYTRLSCKKVTLLSIQVFENEIINRLTAKNSDNVNLFFRNNVLSIGAS